MDGLALIATFLIIGIGLSRVNGLPENFAATLASFAVRVSLPALVLHHLHALPMEAGVLFPSAMPWLVFMLVAGIAWAVGRYFRLRPETVGCLILVCGTGNTSIVGVPMVQAFAGEAAVGYALVADQSNFIVMSTLGFLVASLYSPQEIAGGPSMFRRLATYPPILAMVAALVLRPIAFPGWMNATLSILGATLTPLAIISVGAGILRSGAFSNRLGAFLIGTGIKLVVAPAFILALYSFFPAQGRTVISTSVLQAAMPPMIVAGLLAADRKLDPPLAMMLVGWGIPLSFITVFLWSRLWA